MTGDEILSDLGERIDRASLELKKMAYSASTTASESQRLAAKASGLDLIKDWLRSYPRGES